MDKLTFKEYIYQSKLQLIEAAKITPCIEREFSVKRYCKLPLLDETASLSVSLKPKAKLFITLLYEDMESPTVVSIRLDNVDDVDNTKSYQVAWKGSKVLSWLDQNTKQLT